MTRISQSSRPLTRRSSSIELAFQSYQTVDGGTEPDSETASTLPSLRQLAALNDPSRADAQYGNDTGNEKGKHWPISFCSAIPKIAHAYRVQRPMPSRVLGTRREVETICDDIPCRVQNTYRKTLTRRAPRHLKSNRLLRSGASAGCERIHSRPVLGSPTPERSLPREVSFRLLVWKLTKEPAISGTLAGTEPFIAGKGDRVCPLGY